MTCGYFLQHWPGVHVSSPMCQCMHTLLHVHETIKMALLEKLLHSTIAGQKLHRGLKMSLPVHTQLLDQLQHKVPMFTMSTFVFGTEVNFEVQTFLFLL